MTKRNSFPLAERLSFRGVDATGRFPAKRPEDGQGRRVRLAVLDVKMPGLGGIELRKRLHECSPGCVHLPHGHGSRRIQGGLEEASFYLAKPLKIEDLMRRSRKTLNR